MDRKTIISLLILFVVATVGYYVFSAVVHVLEDYEIPRVSLRVEEDPYHPLPSSTFL